MNLYLIRHATPDWTRKDLAYHIPPGPPLTGQGKAEAQLLGHFLNQVGVRQLWASPLERALHTAQIAAEVIGLYNVEVHHELIEWQLQDTEASVQDRIFGAFEAACQLSQQIGPVGLVTHGGPVAMLLTALGMDAATLKAHRVYDSSNPIPPAGVWEVRRNGDERPWSMRLVFMPGKISTEK